MKSRIEIRIWSEGAEQPDNCDMPELFQAHVEHVASQLAQGYLAGEVVGEGDVRGWWEIING